MAPVTKLSALLGIPEKKAFAIAQLRREDYFDLGYKVLDERTVFNPVTLCRAGAEVLALARLAAPDDRDRSCLEILGTHNVFFPHSDQETLVRVVDGIEMSLAYPSLKPKVVHDLIREAGSLFSRSGKVAVSQKGRVPTVHALNGRVTVTGFRDAPAFTVTLTKGDEPIPAGRFYEAVNTIGRFLAREVTHRETTLRGSFVDTLTLDLLVYHSGGICAPSSQEQRPHPYALARLHNYASIGRGRSEGIKTAKVSFNW